MCKKDKKAYEMFKHDTDICKGCEAVRWFPKYLSHTSGKWKGQPFILFDWQREIIYNLFGTIKKNGKRKYNFVYIEVPKKNGKSELAAGVAIKLAFADGEASPEIYSAACDRDQANIVFGVARKMVIANKELAKRCKIIESTKRIVHNTNGGIYRIVSAEAYSKDGYNIHGLIFDELHRQRNRELYDTMTMGAGDARDQPVFFMITTAGYDRNSICWEVHEKARQVKEGTLKLDNWLVSMYSADEKDDWADEKVWAACNPSLNKIIDIEKVRLAYNEAKEVPPLENDFRRKRLNQWVKQESRYLPMKKWDECDRNIDKLALKGKYFYGGLDLASSTDIAAFVMVHKDEDRFYHVLPFFWVPEEAIEIRSRRDKVPYAEWAAEGLIEATPGNVIDYAHIEAKIDDLQNDYDIQEIAFDRWGAVQISQNLEEKGFTVVPFGQGYASMGEPTKELLKIVLAGKLIHGANPVLRWMADNVVVRMDPAENYKPDKSKSTERIDGIVALIMAISRADVHGQSGSVYDDHDLILI